MKPDFSGWATKNDLRCSDGRLIRKNAFKHNDGQTVPLVWGHKHDSPADVIGYAELENRDEGVYAYCYLNDSEAGKAAKEVVRHGDVRSLSIYANQLKQIGQDVIHGVIREVSLVLAGANPGAFIDSVMAHGDGEETGLVLGYDENVMLWHSDDPPQKCGEGKKKTEDEKKELEHARDPKPEDEETIGDIVESMTPKQRGAMNWLLTQALQEDPEDWASDPDDPEEPEDPEDNDDSKGGDKTMKHNAFDKNPQKQEAALSHSDCQDIIALAKQNGVGSLRTAISIFAEEAAAQGNEVLQHGIDNIESLFPDYKDLRPGAPELLTRDQGWVTAVMNKVHKSPISRIRTRQMDARNERVRGQGYQKGRKKTPAGNMNMISRTTDPQTVYCIDSLNRDDIIDIVDFDVVEYQYGTMKQNLYEEVALGIMVGDGRDEGDEMKISESHIRSIWNDDDLYAIHYDVDIAAARNELQGSRTDMNFGENYIYAEAIVSAALYSREKYKGTGTPDLYCTPHLVNVMLLARDMNGRRIYTSKTELAAALNVGEIYTAEQFEGLVRMDEDGNKHKLLGIFVNLADYTVGSTKGGEITRFDQFDIQFNQQRYLIESRLSGALTRLYSAIVLEEPVKPAGALAA